MPTTTALFCTIADWKLRVATRNSDRLDFHEVSVWGLKEALQAAFTAGQQSKQMTQPN